MNIRTGTPFGYVYFRILNNTLPREKRVLKSFAGKTKGCSINILKTWEEYSSSIAQITYHQRYDQGISHLVTFWLSTVSGNSLSWSSFLKRTMSIGVSTGTSCDKWSSSMQAECAGTAGGSTSTISTLGGLPSSLSKYDILQDMQSVLSVSIVPKTLQFERTTHPCKTVEYPYFPNCYHLTVSRLFTRSLRCALARERSFTYVQCTRSKALALYGIMVNACDVYGSG